MDGINFDVGLNTSGFNSAIGSMQGSMNGLANTAKGVGKAIAVALGGAAVMSAVKDATKAFHDYEQGIAEITTLTDGDAKKAMQKYGDTVKTVMRTSGEEFGTAKNAVYDFVSTFGEVEDMEKMLALAGKQAIAGVTDSGTAVKFLGSAIQGFGLPATEEMTEKMFNLGQLAVKYGRTTFPRLAASMGKAVPVAEGLGITTEEFFANLSASTKVMDSTSEAVTGMKAALSNLMKPTESMQTAMGDYAESVGLSRDATAQTIIESQGLTKALQGIAAEAEGNNSALAEMFGSVEGLNWVLSVTGENSKNVTSTLKEMEDATGTTEEAYEKMADTSAFAFKQMRTEANLLKIAFGELFAEIATPFAKQLTVRLEDWTVAIENARENFVDWRDELQSKGSFQEKMEFTLDSVVSIATDIVDAAGNAIHNFANYLRTEVLGVPATDEANFLNDITTTVKAGVRVVEGVMTWFGGKIDEKADATRQALGLEGDNNSEFDIGDIRVIATAAWGGFTNKMSEIGTTMYNEIVNTFTGRYPEGIDIGEQKARATVGIEVADVIMSAAEISAAVAGGLAAIKGIATWLSGTTITIPQIFLTIGAIKLGWDIGSWIGEQLVEEMNENNTYQKISNTIARELSDVWPEAVKQVTQEGPGEGIMNQIKWLGKRWAIAAAAKIREGWQEQNEKFAAEEDNDLAQDTYEAIFEGGMRDMSPSEGGGGGTIDNEESFWAPLVERTQQEIADAISQLKQAGVDAKEDFQIAGKQFTDAWNGFWYKIQEGVERGTGDGGGGGAFGRDRGLFESIIEKTNTGVARMKKKIDVISADLGNAWDTISGIFKPVEITTGEGFFEGFFSYLSTTRQRMKEELGKFEQDWNEFVSEWNTTAVEDLGLEPLKEMSFNFEETADKAAKNMKEAMDQQVGKIGGETQKSGFTYTINFEANVEELAETEKNQTGSLTYETSVLPLSEKQRIRSGLLNFTALLQEELTEDEKTEWGWLKLKAQAAEGLSAEEKTEYGKTVFDSVLGESLSESEKTEYGTLIFKGKKSSEFGDFISGIFDNAQSKIDEMKQKISDVLSSGEEKKTSLDERIDELIKAKNAYEKEINRDDNIGEQSLKNLQAVNEAIAELETASIMIDVGTSGLGIVNTGLAITKGLMNLIEKGATAIINADTPGKQKIEDVNKDVDELDGKTSTSTLDANDNASGVVETVQNKIDSMSGKELTIDVDTNISASALEWLEKTGGGNSTPGHTNTTAPITPAELTPGATNTDWIRTIKIVAEDNASSVINKVEETPLTEKATDLTANPDPALSTIQGVNSMKIPDKSFTIHATMDYSNLWSTQQWLNDNNLNTTTPESNNTTAPEMDVDFTMPDESGGTNINININGDTIEDSDSSRQKITEWVYEGLKEAGVTE